MRKLSTWVLALLLVVAMAFGAAAAETQNNDQALAQIVETGVYYSDLSDAMQAATDGQTVRLLKDAEEVILTVKEHTTLDLNGCTLTVTYASVFGYMEDNSAANTGVLKVAEKKLLINSKNSQLPVKTENGYQFVEVLGFHTVWANENTFVFQPLFEKAGNELLKSGVANTGVSIQVEVTWKPGVGSEDLDSRTFKYGGTLINEYFNSYNAETGKYGKMFTLTLVNPDNFVDLVCYSKVVSTARVAFAPDQNNSDGHVWTEATCTAPKTCSVCGATEGEALGHSEETVAGKAATCTEDGLTEGKKCTVCGVTTVEQTVIDAKGHTEETVAGKAATCTENGLTEGKKCTVCGVTTVEQTVIDAKGHTEETVTGKAATCTETGLTDGKKCTVCGVTTVAQTEIPATGEHNYVNGTCTGCGETELVEIDYSGTYYIAAIRSSGNYWYMTSDLGTASTKRYTAVDSGVKELPTNITFGEKDLTFTLIKQEDGTYIIMANGVESTDCYVAWSSGNSGYFAKTGRKLTVDMNDDGTFLIHFAGDEERYLSLNSTSGSNYFAFYKGTQSQMLSLIPATVCEHEWNDGEITTSATCTEQGVKTYTCVNGCTKTELVEAIGHTTDLGVCDRCGETIGETDEPTVVLEITKSDFNTTSYAANNGTKTKNGYSYTTNQIMNQQSTMQWQKRKGYITIASNVFTKLELKVAAGTFTVTVGGKTVKGTTVNGVTTYDLTGLTGQVKISVGGATGKVDYLKFYK